MIPVLHEKDFLEFPDVEAEKIASEIAFVCVVDKEEGAFESVSDFDFDESVFDDFIAEYIPIDIATESISTTWGKLINFEKEIKITGNAMAKAAGIAMLPGTDGFSTSAPRKKDGQYYTRATFAFADGQAVRILFYNPDRPEEKHRYPSEVVSFQIFLNKKDITPHLVKGGGKDYGPRKFGKIIGNLLKKNSEKFQQKNAEIKAQKEELENLDKELSDIAKQRELIESELQQSKEKGVFLLKQRDDWKAKAEEERYKKEASEYTAPDGKKHDIPQTDNQPGSDHLVFWNRRDVNAWINGNANLKKSALNSLMEIVTKDGDVYTWINSADYENSNVDGPATPIIYKKRSAEEKRQKEIEESKVETEAGTSWQEGVYSKFVGKKSDIGLSTKEIAKAIRDDIKEARKTGNILDAGGKTYSVRMKNSSITVELKALPDGVELFSEKYKKHLGQNDPDLPFHGGRYSKEVKDTIDKLKSIMAQYERSETDIQTDYFSYNFYSFVNVDYGLENKERERIINAAASPEVEQPVSRDDLKSALIAEYSQLRENPDTPPFTMGIDVARKKDNVAGKVRLDIKKAEVDTLEALNDLKGKIESIVNAHTDSYEIFSEKAEKLITKEIEVDPQQPDPVDPEQPQQEQVEDTSIKQSDVPPEEKPAGSDTPEVGRDYTDRNGITKLVTHEVNGRQVSSVEIKGFINSAYLRGGKWTSLPIQEKTTISEDDLKKAIDKTEEAYQIADDILSRKYDSQGYEKAEQLLDKISEVIEDDAKLMRVDKHVSRLLADQFSTIQA